MESIPKNPILEFHPDTLVAIRKQYNLHTAARMNEAIDILEEWIKKQEHFVKQSFPREYLERCIIFSKGSVERAKHKLDKLCTYRSLHPMFFEIFDKNEKILTSALMPQLTPDHYRVFVVNTYVKDLCKGFLNDYKYNIHMLQYMLRFDYSNGIIFVEDYRQTNIMEMVKYLNVIELNKFVNIITEGFGMRIKSIHMLTSSKAIDVMVSLFKKVVSEKLGQRIHVHTSLESLHKCLPKEILPEEYGGNEKPLEQMHENFVNTITSMDNIDYMIEMSKACTKEEYRQKDDLCNDALPGTFRTLALD